MRGAASHLVAQLAWPKLVRNKHTLAALNDVEVVLPRKHPQISFFHAQAAVALECRLCLGELALIREGAAAALSS